MDDDFSDFFPGGYLHDIADLDGDGKLNWVEYTYGMELLDEVIGRDEEPCGDSSLFGSDDLFGDED